LLGHAPYSNLGAFDSASSWNEPEKLTKLIGVPRYA
jgi:hypothetical protein